MAIQVDVKGGREADAWEGREGGKGRRTKDAGIPDRVQFCVFLNPIVFLLCLVLFISIPTDRSTP